MRTDGKQITLNEVQPGPQSGPCLVEIALDAHLCLCIEAVPWRLLPPGLLNHSLLLFPLASMTLSPGVDLSSPKSVEYSDRRSAAEFTRLAVQSLKA